MFACLLAIYLAICLPLLYTIFSSLETQNNGNFFSRNYTPEPRTAIGGVMMALAIALPIGLHYIYNHWPTSSPVLANLPLPPAPTPKMISAAPAA